MQAIGGLDAFQASTRAVLGAGTVTSRTATLPRAVIDLARAFAARAGSGSRGGPRVPTKARGQQTRLGLAVLAGATKGVGRRTAVKRGVKGAIRR